MLLCSEDELKNILNTYTGKLFALNFAVASVLRDGATKVETFPLGANLTLSLCGATGSCCTKSFTGSTKIGAHHFLIGDSHPCPGTYYDWRAFQQGDTRVEMEVAGTDMGYELGWLKIKFFDTEHHISCNDVRVQGNGGVRRLDKDFCSIKLRFW